MKKNFFGQHAGDCLKIRSILLPILKYAAAIIPIWWILSRTPLSDLLNAFWNVAWWTFPIVTAIGLLLMFLQGLRWWLLIRAFDPSLSLARALKHHFASLFYSIALPTSYSQDVVRSVLLSRESNYSAVWGATWVCRILGLITHVGFSIGGILTLDHTLISRDIIGSLLIAGLIVAALLAVSFSKRITRPFRRIICGIVPSKLLRLPETIRDGIYAYGKKPQEFATALVLTMVTQAIAVLNVAIILKGICGRFFLSETFAFIPLIEIISISQPLTPNGMGIREGLTAIMFSRIGLDKEDLSIYVLVVLYAYLLRLAGVVAALRSK